MLAAFICNLQRKITLKEETVYIPKVLSLSKPKRLTIAIINVNRLTDTKFQKLKARLLNEWDILFIIEAWSTPQLIPGFDRYIYPDQYANTLYVKSSIKYSVELLGCGFNLNINGRNMNLVYIPPNSQLFIPEGPTYGDINWRSNNFIEPEIHETNKKKTRTGKYIIQGGTAIVNDHPQYKFEPFESDHQILIITKELVTNINKFIDSNKVVKHLFQASCSTEYKIPFKKVTHRCNKKYNNLCYWIFKRRTRLGSRFLNQNIINSESLKSWKDILVHKEDKTYVNINMSYNLSRFHRINSHARDIQGLNVKDVLFVMNYLKSQDKIDNLWKAIQKDNKINTLALKKSTEINFNPNKIRLICILPTYIKLLEQLVEGEDVESKIRTNFVGFMKGQTTMNLIAAIILNTKPLKI